MAARRFAIALVIVTTFCTLLLLMCPAASGPYPATHGPATALRAMRLAAIVMFGMLLAATSLAGSRHEPALLWIRIPGAQSVPPGNCRFVPVSSELRC